MSIWGELVKGFTEGVITVAAYQSQVSERGRIDRLCRELNWSVDERSGSVIHLHFNSPVGVRKVRITSGDEALVTFSAYSLVVMAPENIPTEVLGYLLRRNLDDCGIGMWGLYVDDEERVTFHIMYDALGDGLDPPTLKFICESLLAEVTDFESKMRQAKLLR